MANPKIYFIKSSDDVGSALKEAFLVCKNQKTETVLCDIAEFRVLYKKNFNPLMKHIVVTNNFSGEDFTELKELENIRLVGPLCVLACHNDGMSIPNSKGPFLNIAMKGAVICCSGIPKAEKARLANHINLMYGYVTDEFLTNTTHLVSDSVITVKYAIAAENGINIMTPIWIDMIWKESQNRIVRYNNEEFNKFKCPVFYNLRICATGFTRSFGDNISRQIRKHGGTFSDEMSLSKTDVLICYGSDNIHSSSKYKAAISRRGSTANIRCLSVQWIHDSIRKGYALPEEDYAIHNRSTPIAKINKDNDMDSDIFLLSRINGTDLSVASCTTIDATIYMPNEMKRDLSKTIDLSVLKQANTFLDGCHIYLICITGDDLAFVQHALKYTGAIRLDSYSDRITHVVIGDDKNDANRQDLRTLMEYLRNQQSIHIVSMRWLVDSIKAQSPIAEDTYSVSLETSPQTSQDIDKSPLSKKGLKLLRTDTSILAEANASTSQNRIPNNSTFKAPDELQQYIQSESDTLAQYWNDGNSEDLDGVDTLENATIQSIANPNEMESNADQSYFLKNPKRLQKNNKTTSSVRSHAADDLCESRITTPLKSDDSTILDNDKTFTFNKKTFLLLQFDMDDMDELTKRINSLDGCVVSRTNSGTRSYRGVTDYAIVPVFADREATRTVAAEHVFTDIWVRECSDKGRPVIPDYYHRCVTEAANNVLNGCVVSTSSFKHSEQSYLIAVIGHMGGHTQGDLSKMVHENRGLLITTHLLTNSSKVNKKYEAAKRWGIPIVTSHWVDECLRAGKRLPEVNYPVLQEEIDTSKFVSPKCVTPRNSSTKKQRRTASDTLQDLASDNNPGTPQDTNKKRKTSVFETPQFQSPAFSQSPSSQVTPVTRQYNEVMARIKSKIDQGLLYDSDCDSPTKSRLSEQRALLKTPDTPTTPFSANLLGPNATRAERRELREFLNKIPHNTPPPPARTRRLSTPMSELKRKFIAKCDENYENECQKLRTEALERHQLPDQEKQCSVDKGNDHGLMHNVNNNTNKSLETVNNTCDTNNSNVPAHIIDEKLRNLSDMLGTPISNSKPPKLTSVTPVSGFSELPDSQTYSVGWDYDVDVTAAKYETKERVFLITGCVQSEKDTLQSKIGRLGAKLAPDQTKFDKVTHLLCNNVSRNEKTLCSIASGKWVLHVDFIEESLKAGKFLDEELFEFGNPKSKITVESADVERARCAVYWRQTIEKTSKGAFHDMRAIIVSTENDNAAYTSITNIVEAGGGAIVQSRPPYENNDYATHCLINVKAINDMSDFVPLAKCGIYCVRHIYISNFLLKKNLNILQEVLPQLAQYYSK